MNPGALAILLASALAVVGFVEAIRWARGRSRSERSFRLAYHGMVAMLVVASAILLAAILTHDFRYAYVSGYSSRDLPLLYLVSAFWAGQQGSFLTWALAAALFGYGLTRRGAWEPAWAMVAYLPTVGFLLALMLSTDGNPFRMLAEIPADGRGMNPLLQDPWMAIHPPLVFLGYAAMAIPAALGLVALWRRREDAWLTDALRWTLVAFVMLGLGIILGGFWAYKVLGWGGYWGWDPVENASLVPWIVAAILLHGILVQRRTGSLRASNLGLALAGYVLVLWSTFLTRSGVLADFSVHSFPSGEIYRMLVAILLVVVGVSTLAMIRRRDTGSKPIAWTLTWPSLLSAVMILLGLSAALVLVGTCWPIVSGLVGTPSSVGPAFYNTVNLPLYILLLAVLAIGPFLSWTAVSRRAWGARVAVATGIAALVTAGAVALGARGAGALALLFAAVAALVANLVKFAQLARGRMLATGAPLAHAGFALMFVGVVASSMWSRSEEVRLPLGQPTPTIGGTVTFLGVVEGSQPENRWRIGLERPGKAPHLSEVTMYQPEGAEEGSLFRRPTIVRELARDIYLSPVGLEPGHQHGGQLDVGADPVRYGELSLRFLDFAMGAGSHDQGMTVNAVLEARLGDTVQQISLPVTADASGMRGTPVAVPMMPGVSLTLERMSVEQKRVLVHVDEGGHDAPPVMLAELSTKPVMGLLWAGTALLLLGCCVAATRRFRDSRATVDAGSATATVAPRPAAKKVRVPATPAAARAIAASRD